MQILIPQSLYLNVYFEMLVSVNGCLWSMAVTNPQLDQFHSNVLKISDNIYFDMAIVDI